MRQLSRKEAIKRWRRSLAKRLAYPDLSWRNFVRHFTGITRKEACVNLRVLATQNSIPWTVFHLIRIVAGDTGNLENVANRMLAKIARENPEAYVAGKVLHDIL